MELKSLNEFLEMAQNCQTKRVAVAAAEDEPVLSAVNNAMAKKLVIPVLVGDEPKIREIAASVGMNLDGIKIVHEPKPVVACKLAVKLIRDGEAEVLMKGLVPTADLLRAVLDKENGLRKGSTISHIAFFESPAYHKLIVVTDAAMNIAPEFKEKVAIVNNAVEACHDIDDRKLDFCIFHPEKTLGILFENEHKPLILLHFVAKHQPAFVFRVT